MMSYHITGVETHYFPRVTNFSIQCPNDVPLSGDALKTPASLHVNTEFYPAEKSDEYQFFNYF